MNSIKEENPIVNFSLNELLRMTGDDGRKGLMRECIIANSSSHMHAFKFPCRIDVYIVGVGTKGETTLSCDLKEYKLKKNSLFIFEPNNILQTKTHDDFECHVLLVSPDLMRKIKLDTKHMMPLLLKFVTNPTMELTDEESAAISSYISQIERESKEPDSFFAEDIIINLIAATSYKIGDMLHKYLSRNPEMEEPIHNRAEEYFRQFMLLLTENYKEHRSVSFYAKKLCITPKYLTTLIKRISGKSVSEWIDSYVVLEAKTLLKFSNMSIQEIAYYLNFPNQSFFGSYFKRNTGMSPSQYKTTK